MKYITLNNGLKIPPIGIGPSVLPYNKKVTKKSDIFARRLLRAIYLRGIVKFTVQPRYVASVSYALQKGYRLIDNSVSYQNEKFLGKAIKDCGVNRDEIFVTTRVSNSQQYRGNIRSQLMKSLRDLDMEYIDLYMFHWPVTDHYLSTWEQMVELYQEGYVKALGVANCHKHHLEEIIDHSNVIPAINQIEVHPLFSQKPLIEYCKSKGVVVEAYTPLARNDERLLRNRILEDIGKKYHKTIQQIVLRWHIQNGLIPVPRSLNPNRQLENLCIFDFELTSDEMDKIDSININSRLRYDPDNCDFLRL